MVHTGEKIFIRKSRRRRPTSPGTGAPLGRRRRGRLQALELACRRPRSLQRSTSNPVHVGDAFLDSSRRLPALRLFIGLAARRALREEGRARGSRPSSPFCFGVWRAGNFAHRWCKAELLRSRSSVPGCESHSLIRTSSNTPANTSRAFAKSPRVRRCCSPARTCPRRSGP